MSHRSLTPAQYVQQIDHGTGLEKHERVRIDGGHADIDTFVDHVELTIRLGDRVVFGFQLAHREAEQIGMALARPRGTTVTDVFQMADELGTDAVTLFSGARR